MGILEPILTRVSDVSVRLAVCLVLEPVLLRGHAEMVRVHAVSSPALCQRRALLPGRELSLPRELIISLRFHA